jgi:hypothetical protein
MLNEEVFPVKVIETFHIINNCWDDFVCIWKRVVDKETNITISHDIVNNIGLLEKSLNENNFKTIKKC